MSSYDVHHNDLANRPNGRASLLTGTILSRCPTCHRGWADEAEAARIAAEIAAAEASRDRTAAAELRRVKEEARREGIAAQEVAATARIEALIAERDALKETMETAIDARVEQRVAARDVTHERQLADLRQQLTTAQLEFASKEKRWQEDAEKLKRRAEDKSANTLGDPAQHNLRRGLAEAFPDADVTETIHGAAGTDVFVTFKQDGVEARVALESKNNSKMSPTFIPQLKADMRRHGIEHGILVLATMPPDHRTDDYFEEDGIMIVQAKSAVSFVGMIRPFLLRDAKGKLAGRNTGAKGAALINYVLSEPVAKLWNAKTFAKLREEDEGEVGDLERRNNRRNKLYKEHEALTRDVHAEIDRILQSDDAAA
jgi:hypothetical protein